MILASEAFIFSFFWAEVPSKERLRKRPTKAATESKLIMITKIT